MDYIHSTNSPRRSQVAAAQPEGREEAKPNAITWAHDVSTVVTRPLSFYENEGPISCKSDNRKGQEEHERRACKANQQECNESRAWA